MPNLAHATTHPLTPRRLILEMLDADPGLMASGQRLVVAGEVFSYSNNQIRVALSRLVADGLLMKPKRGEYAFSNGGSALQRETQRWQHIEQQLQIWQGDWCGILTDSLATEGSTGLRAQTRALALRGLRRWRPGLWVRPNNLSGGLGHLADELTTLGLDAMNGQCLISSGNADCRQGLQSLWDVESLEKEYGQRLKALSQASKRLQSPKVPAVLIETIQVGGDTIRALLRDPLLPDALHNGDSRRQLIALLQQYDQQGRLQWRNFIQQL